MNGKLKKWVAVVLSLAMVFAGPYMGNTKTDVKADDVETKGNLADKVTGTWSYWDGSKDVVQTNAMLLEKLPTRANKGVTRWTTDNYDANTGAVDIGGFATSTMWQYSNSKFGNSLYAIPLSYRPNAGGIFVTKPSTVRIDTTLLQQQPEDGSHAILITDGGYCGMESSLLAEEKNITLVTTDLKGSEVSDHWADFEFNEDGTKLLRCAAGHEPKSSIYDKNTQKCKASFPLAACKNCPYHSQCHPKEHKRVATIKIAMRTAFHARQQRFLKTEEFKTLAHFRNGIETVPAALRSRHHVDRMPVRGYIKTKLFFGFKVAGMNARKLIRYLTGLVKVATYPEIA